MLVSWLWGKKLIKAKFLYWVQCFAPFHTKNLIPLQNEKILKWNGTQVYTVKKSKMLKSLALYLKPKFY